MQTFSKFDIQVNHLGNRKKRKKKRNCSHRDAKQCTTNLQEWIWKTKQFYCLRRIHWVYWHFSIRRKYGRGSTDHNTILRIQIEGFFLWTITIYWKRTKWGKLVHLEGLPRCLSSKESDCPCRSSRRRGFNPWVRKIPWSRKWPLTPLSLPGKFHGQTSLVGCSP